jgi:hypothetical protein
MKRNDKNRPVVLMTTKKGSEKGTRKVFMVDLENMDTVDITDNVKGVIYEPEFPVGVAGMITGGIMVMNKALVAIDPIHALKEISKDDLDDVQLSHYDYTLEGAQLEYEKSCSTHKDDPFLTEEDFSGFLDNVKGKSIKDIAMGIEELIVDILGHTLGAQHEGYTEEPPKQSTKTAQEKMEEASALLDSGKMTKEKFREIFPEGSMLEFSKQLSEETGDPTFYSIGKILNDLRPSK